MDAPREGVNLLGGFQYGKFWGFHDASLDEAQAEVLLVLLGLRLDDQTDDTLYLGYEPDEQEGVGDIEAGMERCQHNRKEDCLLCLRGTSARWIVAYQRTDRIDKGIEQAEHPDHAKDVEHQVGQGRPSGLCVGSQRREVGRGRRADVLTQHEGNTEVDRKDARGAQQDGDGHDGGTALHDAGDEGANEHEDHYVEMAMGVKGGEEVDGVRIVFQIKFFASCR